MLTVAAGLGSIPTGHIKNLFQVMRRVRENNLEMLASNVECCNASITGAISNQLSCTGKMVLTEAWNFCCTR